MGKTIKLKWWEWELGKILMPFEENVNDKFKIVKQANGFVYFRRKKNG